MSLEEFINFAIKASSWDNSHEQLAEQVRMEHPKVTDLQFIVPHIYLKLGAENLLTVLKVVKRCSGSGLKECRDAVDAHHQRALATLEELKFN